MDQKKIIEMEERREGLYNKLYNHSEVERYTNATISKETRAALAVKAKVQDALNALVWIQEILYGEIICDEDYNKIMKAMEPAGELADKYLLASITESLGSLDSTEI